MTKMTDLTNLTIEEAVNFCCGTLLLHKTQQDVVRVAYNLGYNKALNDAKVLKIVPTETEDKGGD